MSSNEKKYIKEEILKKFDEFIQESLNKYFYVDAWDKLYSITGKDSYDIISNKSTIPDLVIYNKPFNKNDCFFNSNKKSKHKKFPRVQFILRPKEIEFYNPSNTYADKNEEEEEKTNSQILEPFEFRSIPKEIEDKYNKNINTRKENNNSLLDELKAFMKDDKNDESKVKLIKEDEKNEAGIKEKDEKNNNNNKVNNENRVKKRKYSNNNKRMYGKNKFERPINMNIMNNINYNSNINNITYNNYFIYQRMYYQNMNSPNNINKLNISNINNSNNNQINPIQKEIKENINNDINNKINNNVNNIINNKNNTNSITSYYNNKEIKDVDIEKIINNIDELINKNKQNRNWKVIDLKDNITLYKFNSEELFLFLKTIINSKEDKNYSISDIDCDILFNPIKIYEDLKNKYQKSN